jgi:hypothetical protein
MLPSAFERGDDITDVNLLPHAGRGALLAVRLQRTLQSRRYLARSVPATGLIEEPRIGPQLGLIALGVMEASIAARTRARASLWEGVDLAARVEQKNGMTKGD